MLSKFQCALKSGPLLSRAYQDPSVSKDSTHPPNSTAQLPRIPIFQLVECWHSGARRDNLYRHGVDSDRASTTTIRVCEAKSGYLWYKLYLDNSILQRLLPCRSMQTRTYRLSSFCVAATPSQTDLASAVITPAITHSHLRANFKIHIQAFNGPNAVRQCSDASSHHTNADFRCKAHPIHPPSLPHQPQTMPAATAMG